MKSSPAEKLRHRIRVLRRQIREKQGIIIGIQTPVEKQESVLAQTRADLRALRDELDATKGEYTNELEKDKRKQCGVFVGNDDNYDGD